MMIRQEFDKRLSEIDSFFEIVRIIELEKPHISAYNIKEEKKEENLTINSEKIDTLRSTTYLLLYNLIESTIYNSIVSIFDDISDKQLKYFDIIEEVKRFWIDNKYKHDEKKKKETIIETIMDVANQIFNNKIVLASKEINYGGSLDVRNILNTAKSMRIDVGNIHKKINEDKDLYGDTFKAIKDNRNWLAHGEKSFIEVGSKSTYSELQTARDCVVDVLYEFINSVESYIQNQDYKIAY